MLDRILETRLFSQEVELSMYAVNRRLGISQSSLENYSVFQALEKNQ